MGPLLLNRVSGLLDEYRYNLRVVGVAAATETYAQKILDATAAPRMLELIQQLLVPHNSIAPLIDAARAILRDVEGAS